MFGRATIRLGIGPHSSYFFIVCTFFKATCCAVYCDEIGKMHSVSPLYTVGHKKGANLFLSVPLSTRRPASTDRNASRQGQVVEVHVA